MIVLKDKAGIKTEVILQLIQIAYKDVNDSTNL